MSDHCDGSAEFWHTKHDGSWWEHDARNHRRLAMTLKGVNFLVNEECNEYEIGVPDGVTLDQLIRLIREVFEHEKGATSFQLSGAIHRTT